MTTTRSICLTIALALPVCTIPVAPQSARAAPTPQELQQAEALATEGKLYFRTKQFDKAAELFMKAYVKGRSASLVYNAARAYEEAGKLKQAIATFEHYQTLAADDPKGRSAAAGRVAALKVRQAELDAQAKRARDAEAAENARKAAAAAAAAQRREQQADRDAKAAAAQPKPQAGAAPSPTVRAAAPQPFPVWRSVAAGGLVLASVGAYVAAVGAATELPAEEVVDDATKQKYLTNQDRASTWRVVAIGAGVAGVGVGAWAFWHWWTARRAGGKTAESAAMTLLPMAHGTGVVAAHRF